ncbi:heparan-alpha-glucosaminide N-acetyltransferase domain-containing protein [Methanobrevibacter gottschalkii]|uniref:heparan-alpha-glucosaminide N-acetyltransferase domain-containing protein n=1 Tax=Methanobrevibacter gottschalkii TaxID=190974 RepID=UPI0026EEF851|nr:heparan-alpha-glucosaminide N-acetyltransferase domain-containing protein [Methanobrevibacter gottschalkii]
MVLIKEISPSYGFIVGNVLGRPYAAPIFMFCMGVGIVYSRRSQWDIMVKRGITLFLLGILVNVFEFFLPYYVCGTLLGSWDIFPIAGGLLLFCVDILAFAGLSFILMGILKKFELSNKKLIVIALLMSIIGSLLRDTDLGIPVLNLIFGNFIGTAGGFTAFPLFNWFIFPIAGYI